MDSFLEIHSYLTGKLEPSQVKNIYINDGVNGKDVITGLRSVMNFGRPNWDSIFEAVRTKHPGIDIGVFYWYSYNLII